MRNTFLFILNIFLFLGLSAQDIIYKGPLKLNSNTKLFGQVAVGFTSDAGETPVFVYDEKTFYTLYFNEDFSQKRVVAFPPNHIPFRTLLMGMTGEAEGNHYLYYSDIIANKFVVETVNPSTQKSSFTELPFDFVNEVLLTTVLHRGTFYMLTVSYPSSHLFVYEVKGDTYIGKKRVEPKDNSASDRIPPENLFSNLYQSRKSYFRSVLLGLSVNPMIKIARNRPSTLVSASKKVKFYQKGQKLLLTMDHDLDYTAVAKIDFVEANFEVTFYDQQTISCKDPFNVSSNSFIYKNLLFQIKACQEELFYSIQYLEADTLLKSFWIYPDQEPDFANTPFRLESMDEKYPLKNTKQGLKKLSKYDLAILAYLNDNKLEITIGGAALGPGGPLGQPISTPIGLISIVNTGPMSYLTHKTLFMKSLLHPQSLTHIQDGVFPHPYERMIKYYVNSYFSSLEFDFEQAGDYYRGYYESKEDQFILRKF